jgi:hypothetical protein
MPKAVRAFYSIIRSLIIRVRAGGCNSLLYVRSQLSKRPGMDRTGQDRTGQVSSGSCGHFCGFTLIQKKSFSDNLESVGFPYSAQQWWASVPPSALQMGHGSCGMYHLWKRLHFCLQAEAAACGLSGRYPGYHMDHRWVTVSTAVKPELAFVRSFFTQLSSAKLGGAFAENSGSVLILPRVGLDCFKHAFRRRNMHPQTTELLYHTRDGT